MNSISKVEIRLAETGDAAEIARLNELFNQVIEQRETYAQRLMDPARVEIPILAWVDQQAVGLTALRVVPSFFYTAPHAELTELFVQQEYRRKGIGRALLTFAERLARQKGARDIILLTDFYNEPALKFYHAMGYNHHDVALSKSL